jgi:small subunit ribosomal protein S5
MPKKGRKQESESAAKTRIEREREKSIERWVPATELGKMVKNGGITSIEEIEKKNIRIMEPEIVEMLVPGLKETNVDFKKTTKVRRSGRKFSFRASVLVGDGHGFIGLGTAKDKERWPAITKATRKAKLSLVGIKKGCGSWECLCNGPHSVPFRVDGRSASVKVTLLPAPKGTGLVAGDAVKDVLKFVGIKDVWLRATGNTRSTLDFVAATIDALSKTKKMRTTEAAPAEGA